MQSSRKPIGAASRGHFMPQRKLFADIKNIAKSEVDFVRDLFDTIVPVKVSWNEEAWQKMQERSLIRVEKRTPNEPGI